jgi:hypothetical protein
MERINPFAEPAEAPVFAPKPRAPRSVETDNIDQIAREQNFPSRQAPRAATAPARKRRTYTTGRNQQINFKATAATIERFYRIADREASSALRDCSSSRSMQWSPPTLCHSSRNKNCFCFWPRACAPIRRNCLHRANLAANKSKHGLLMTRKA